MEQYEIHILSDVTNHFPQLYLLEETVKNDSIIEL